MEKLTKTLFALLICSLGLAIASFPAAPVFSQSLDEQNVEVISINTDSLPEIVLQIRGNSADGDFVEAPISLVEDGDERPVISENQTGVSLQLAIVMDPSQNLTVPGNTGDARWFEVASTASALVSADILSAQSDLVAAYGPNDDADGFGPLAGWLRDHQAVVNTLYLYEPSPSGVQSATVVLSDALLEVLGEFGDVALDDDTVRSIIVFSDGSTLLQTDKVNQVIDLADELNIQINVVMLGANTPIARGNLDRLSNGTNSRFVVLNSMNDMEPLWLMLQQQRTIREVTYNLGSANATSLDVTVASSGGEALKTTVDYPEFRIEPAKLSILSPSDLQELTVDLTSADTDDSDLSLPISLEVLWPDNGAREFSQVDYLVDGDIIAQESTMSEKFTLSVADLENGEHTLSVVAIDELGVVATSPSVNFSLDVTRAAPTQEQTESATEQDSGSIESDSGAEDLGTASAGSNLIESVSDENAMTESETTLASDESAEPIDNEATLAIDNILNDTQLEDEKVGTGMNLFGMQLPETVEIFGVPFLINPVTLLIAAFPLIFALALLTYWLSQRSNTRTTYKHGYDFYDVGQVPTIENHVFFEDDGQLQVTQPQIGIIDIADDVTEPVKVPSFYTTAPAYIAYISGGNHLPKKLPIEGSEPIRIGRKKSFCELVLDDRRVSRLHSVISQLNGEFFIRDEGSSGGTFVNRRKLGTLDNQKLEHNDIINFNEVEYRFEVTTEMLGEGHETPSAYAPAFSSSGTSS